MNTINDSQILFTIHALVTMNVIPYEKFHLINKYMREYMNSVRYMTVYNF